MPKLAKNTIFPKLGLRTKYYDREILFLTIFMAYSISIILLREEYPETIFTRAEAVLK